MTDIVQNVTIPDQPEPITYEGYTMIAPGFDSESFAAAVDRAFADGCSVRPGRLPGTWYVTNPVANREYVVGPTGAPAALGRMGRAANMLP